MVMDMPNGKDMDSIGGRPMAMATDMGDMDMATSMAMDTAMDWHQHQ